MNASRKLWLAGLFGAAAVTVMSLGFAPASLFAEDDDDDKGPSEKAIAQSEAQIPSETLKTPFEKEVPIRFVTSTQNKAVWDKLKDFWNSSEEKVAHPKTGKEVTRKVVLIKVPLGLQTPPPVPPKTRSLSPSSSWAKSSISTRSSPRTTPFPAQVVTTLHRVSQTNQRSRRVFRGKRVA